MSVEFSGTKCFCRFCSFIFWVAPEMAKLVHVCPHCREPSVDLSPSYYLIREVLPPELARLVRPSSARTPQDLDPSRAGSDGSPPGFSSSREPPCGGRCAQRTSGEPRPIDRAMWDYISGAERMKAAGKSEDHARRLAATIIGGVYLDD